MTAAVMRLIREAAADARIERAVAEAVWQAKMASQGACLIAGLAALTAMDANVGKAATVALAELRKRKPVDVSGAAKRER